MSGIPPLEEKKRPLILHWWFLALIFFIVLIAASFAFLVYENVKGIRNGDISTDAGITRDPNATTNAPEFVDVTTPDDPAIGPVDARITIVEFSDFQCPYCREAFPIIRELLSIYAGQIRYQYRDFPVSDAHPDAARAALAGECVAEQDETKFWAFHDQLFIRAEDLSRDALIGYAQQVGADVNAFTTCLDEERFAQEVVEDYRAGIEAGVPGTPTFFVNGYRVPGVVPLDVWKEVIDSVFAQPSTS